MPEPLSWTVIESSGWIVTSTRSLRPARASSTELSTTSKTRWWRPRAPVEPMYMPGRSRTGSRPSRTVMSLAVYEALAMKKALQLAHFRAGVSLPDPAVVGGRCEAHSCSFFYRFAEFFGRDRRRQVVGGARLLQRRLRRSLSRRRGGLRDGLRKGARREAKTLRRGLAELASKTLGDLCLELLQLECPG